MRVKLDENLPIQLKRLFTESGTTRPRSAGCATRSTRTCQAEAHGAA